MTIRHMKIFLQVYSLESITKAAEILNMTQPAVTRAIQEMERYYGVCLFERIGHRLSRTAVGQEFYAHALHIVEAFDRMEKELRDWDEIGKIRLGATNTLGCFFLPDLLLQFQKQYPKLEIISTVTNADGLQSGLHAAARSAALWRLRERSERTAAVRRGPERYCWEWHAQSCGSPHSTRCGRHVSGRYGNSRKWRQSWYRCKALPRQPTARRRTAANPEAGTRQRGTGASGSGKRRAEIFCVW